MKKLFLILLAGALACGTALAQGDAGSSRHTLSVGIGAWPATYDNEVIDGLSSYWYYAGPSSDIHRLW
ncbi:MAG: hypothetical protein LUE26_00645 [Alistipes sp.]|nr:hypothetical protein [Alistipes sp.]